MLPLPEDAKVRLKAQLLTAGGGKELWSAQYEVQVGHEASIPLEVPLPEEEGPYDLVLSVLNNSGWPQAVRRRSVVINPSPSGRCRCWYWTSGDRLRHRAGSRIHASRGDRSGESALVGTVKASQLQQLPQLQLAKTWRLWKGPLGNDNLKPYRHSLGNLVQLNANAESPDVSWEAYWLPISQPGRPHILEVEYPSDVPQTLGISILEPNASGALRRSAWTPAWTCKRR